MSIIEYFDRHRRPALEIEIARALNYPQSSTGSILRTLISQGFITFNPRTRRYWISDRVALMGSWANSALLEPGPVLRLLNELSRTMERSVYLARRAGPNRQCIYAVAPPGEAPILPLGNVAAACASVVGRTLLASESDETITRYVLFSNAHASTSEQRVQLSEVRRMIEDIRAQGYGYGDSIISKGLTCLAAALPRQVNDAGDLAIVFGGSPADMKRRREAFSALLLEAIQRILPRPPAVA